MARPAGPRYAFSSVGIVSPAKLCTPCMEAMTNVGRHNDAQALEIRLRGLTIDLTQHKFGVKLSFAHQKECVQEGGGQEARDTREAHYHHDGGDAEGLT